MTWWLTTRRAVSALGVALAVYAALLLAMGGTFVTLPSLVTIGGSSTPLALVAPVPVCCAVVISLEADAHYAEGAGTRLVSLMDAALVVVTVAVTTTVSVVLGWSLDTPQVTAAGRNTAFLTGLTLLVRAMAGNRAVLVPPGWILLTTLFGYQSVNDPWFWSVIPYPPGTGHALIASGVTFAAGLLATVVRPRGNVR